MSLGELDGFFCAFICGPDLVAPPSEYLPHVFGGEPIQGSGFKTVEEAPGMLNAARSALEHYCRNASAGRAVPSLIAEYDDAKVTGQEWALGFQQGMYLRRKAWERLAKDEELGAALLPVIVLAEDDGHRLTSDPVMPEEREAMLDVLAASVLIIYRYFRGQLKPLTPPRRAKKSSRVKKP